MRPILIICCLSLFFLAYKSDPSWTFSFHAMAQGDTITRHNEDYQFQLVKCDSMPGAEKMEFICHNYLPFPTHSDEIVFKQYFDEIDDSKFVLIMAKRNEKIPMRIFMVVTGKAEKIELGRIHYVPGDFDLDGRNKQLIPRS